MREGLETLSAAGVHTDRSPQALAMRLIARLPEPVPLALLRLTARTRLGEIPMLGSTWQSVMRGSPTEIEYLNGEIVALGARMGFPTPYNARAVELVREVERSGRFRPPEELWPA
jgi:2-dehydropantoate 2-reductase